MIQNRCRLTKWVFLGLMFHLMSGFISTTFGQSANLSELAQHVGKILAEQHIHKVTAADFVDNGGSVTLQGAFLADRFVALLEPKDAFQVLDRSPLRKGLYSHQIIPGSAFEGAEMDAARNTGAEALILGTIEKHAQDLTINVTALAVSTGQSLAQRTFSVPRTKILDDLASQLIQSKGPIYLVGQNGVSLPDCHYCPPPLYTEEARKKGLEGHVVLSAIIQVSGRVEKIWELRGLGEGLTEQAVEVVRQWRFRPARDATGKPVAVMVPIEVAFRRF